MAIKVPFIADVSGFLRGTADMEEALEDVADSLDDLARTDIGDVERDLQGIGDVADRTAEQVETLGDGLGDLARVDTSAVEAELKEIGTAGDAAAEKLESSFRSAFDTLKAEGRTATDRTKADLKETGTAGSTTMQEFKQEAKQNVGETISSFNGSASSAVDAIQGTLGGLVSALGPAGIVGVAVAGIGIGLARSMFGKAEERAELFRDKVLSLFEELRENGDITPEFRLEGISEIIANADALKKVFDADNVADFNDQIAETQLTTGELRVYFKGLTGDMNDNATAVETLRDHQEELYELLRDPTAPASAQAAARNAITTTDEWIAALEDQGNAYGDAREKADLYSRVTGETTEATEDEAKAHDDNAAAILGENEQLRIAADLKGDVVANELDMRDALDDVTAARKKNGDSLSKNTAAGRDNLRAVKNAIDGIKDYGDALVANGTKSGTATKAMERQERVLVTKVAKAFGITEDKARDYIRTLGGIPPVKNTKVTVDDKGTAKKVQERIDNIKSSGVPVPIEPDLPSPASLQREINAYYNSLSIKVPVRLDRYRSGTAVPP